MRLFCLIVFVAVSNILITKAQNINTDSIDIKAKKLKYLYTLSTESSVDVSNVYKQQFFNEFPNTFKELNELYGYENHTPAPLYNECDKHIYELFNNLVNINDTLYYRKIISIAIDGHWNADGIAEFQDGLHKRVLKNPELTIYLLKNLSENKIRSFWHFYFDDIFPAKLMTEQLKSIKSINTTIYALMVASYKEDLLQWK